MAVLYTPYVKETIAEAIAHVNASHTRDDYEQALKTLLAGILQTSFYLTASQNTVPGRSGQGLQEVIKLAEHIIALSQSSGLDYRSFSTQVDLKKLASAFLSAT